MLPDGLRVVRRVRAGREDAFDAWVNPARLRAWFGPAGTSVVAVDGELRVGEQYRLHVRHEDGSVVALIWSFREIVPPERLVFGWSVAAGPSAGSVETVVTITFRDRGSFTEIALEHTGEQTDQQRQMFAAGWTDCFAGLEALLHQSV
ncbi:MAG TPA: SRPBCC family protein [Solirubrobacteraceae bacterium]|nr:SRPBCC family protein [Solirubrobacteraceae bacterium]